MSVPPDLMKLMAGAQGAGGGAASSAPPSMPSAAGGAPMSTPQPPQGEKQSAMVNVSLAMDLLEQTLPALGSESEEGRTVLTCLAGLSKKFGHTRAKSQGLQPAELQQLMAALPGAGGMSPEAKAMGQQPMQMPGGMPH
jgi:hypothetical protein